MISNTEGRQGCRRPGFIRWAGLALGGMLMMMNADWAHTAPKHPKDEPRHFFGICWQESNGNILRFAKQMGYGHIFYKQHLENDPEARDVKFIIETPQYNAYHKLGVPRKLNRSHSYTDQQKRSYTQNFANKSRDGFPMNMATGWFFGNEEFSVEPDFQQQRVVDLFVQAVIEHAKSKERKDRDFTFGGFAWDVPQLAGDFYDKPQWAGGRQVTLANWTGRDAGIKPDGMIHDHPTYSDGVAAFYKKLRHETLKIWPNAIFIVEPYDMEGDWIRSIKDRSDKNDIMRNTMVVQEKGGTQFMSGPTLGYGLIRKDWAGSTTPDEHSHRDNLAIAASAATNGGWFGWYGRFGGTGDWPDAAAHDEFKEVPHRLLLIRALPGWDNLAGIPLDQRRYGGGRYESANSYADDNVIYGRHPLNRKLFTVFLNGNGRIKLRAGESMVKAHAVNELFIETGDATSELRVEGGEVVPKGGWGEKAYILTTQGGGGTASTFNRSSAAGSDALPPVRFSLDQGIPSLGFGPGGAGYPAGIRNAVGRFPYLALPIASW